MLAPAELAERETSRLVALTCCSDGDGDGVVVIVVVASVARLDDCAQVCDASVARTHSANLWV